MSCGCIKEVFDFSLTYPGKCNHLLYKDLSEWVSIENFSTPTNYEVEIELPNGSKETVTVSGTQETKINLGCLQDGNYTFTLHDLCGETYTRTKAVTCNLNCGLQKLIVKSIRENKFEDEIEEVRNLIAGIEAQTELQNFQSAKSLYDIAKEILDGLNCDCGCK